MAKRICKHEDCGVEYNTRDKKFGFIDECNTCGRNGSDAKTERVGGIMEYECKTNGVLKLTSLESAQAMRKAMDRTGGQGIVRNMAQRKS